MREKKMTSLDRVLTSMCHKEPDRVPFFLLLTMHGAAEMGMSIKEYFSRAENVVEGQIRLREKYRHDCLYVFFYGPLEFEAWGGEVIFRDDGPPNSGEPFIRKPEEIKNLRPPDIKNTPCLTKVLDSVRMLKERAGDDAPILGVVISPFSMPVMQMGFDNYLDLIYERPELFEQLMKINEEFCVEWANMQIAAGATAICYFDPVSSPTIIPRDLFLKTGFKVASRTIGRIKSATGIHLASGRSLPILNYITLTGTEIIGISADDDLRLVKEFCRGKLTILGNLNGIEMRRWTREKAEASVKEAIAMAGRGGDFILSDNHGEIPFQVPDSVLMAISEAVHKWGNYPLEWTDGYERKY